MNNIVLTGSSGFIGKNMLPLLQGKSVLTLGRSKSESIQCDLSNQIPKIQEAKVVVHAAGKAHQIPRNDRERKEFYQVNVNGALNLVKGLSALNDPPELIINLSTVAVYGLTEGQLIDENYPINPSTPYGDSKAKAEEIFLEWGANNGVPVLNARLPLVSGLNPPGNLGYMLHAISKGTYFRIGQGKVRKSILWAPDLAKIVGLRNVSSGNYNLTDGHHPNICDIEDWIGAQVNKRVKSLPSKWVRTAAWLGDHLPGFPLNTERFQKLISPLTFSSAKAEKRLGWNPTPVLKTKILTH